MVPLQDGQLAVSLPLPPLTLDYANVNLPHQDQKHRGE
jgi:hypothetical protein